MVEDRNFDDLADRFEKNIYGSTKGAIRHAVLWRDLTELTPVATDPSLRILDAGAGMGQLALRLAQLGHELVLCDASSEMLRRAQLRFAEQLPDSTARFIHTPIQSLHKHINGTFDVVLFHAVLEWLANPQQTLRALLRFVKQAGYLSMMFYNYHGLVYRHLLQGNIAKVRANDFQGHARSLTPPNPLVPETVYGWLNTLGLDIINKSGVRVFYDYLPPALSETLALDDVVDMEMRYSRQEPFLSLGRYIHVVCRAKTK